MLKPANLFLIREIRVNSSSKVILGLVYVGASEINRGYYMPAGGDEFYLRVVNSISHE